MKNLIKLVNNIKHLSTCQRRKVGALLTDENFNPISLGFNMVISSQEPCCRRYDCESGTNLEKCNAIHAEMVAVANRDIKGKKLFVNLFPCPVCSKYLAQCGLAELYYYEDYPGEDLDLFNRAGIKVFKYKQDGSVQLVKTAKQVEKKSKYFGDVN